MPVPVQLRLSVTFTTIGKVPTTVGVPLSTPAADKVRPAGNVLDVEKVYGVEPPEAVKVWLKAVPAVPVVTPGLVTTGLLITMEALAGVVSAAGTLSTTPFTVPVPPVAPAVYVTVAVPAAVILGCAPDKVPRVALNVMGNPITLTRFAKEIDVPAELVRKLAVTTDVPEV